MLYEVKIKKAPGVPKKRLIVKVLSRYIYNVRYSTRRIIIVFTQNHKFSRNYIFVYYNNNSLCTTIVLIINSDVNHSFKMCKIRMLMKIINCISHIFF